MKKLFLYLTALCVLSFASVSCNKIKPKIGDYYYSKARKIASQSEVSEKEIDKIYEYLIKALDYKNKLPGVVELVDNITQASLKAGYIKAYDNQIKFLKKYVEKNPFAFDAYINLINIYSLKGDLYHLSNMSDEISKKLNENINFYLLKSIVDINLIYWLEVYGYNALNEGFDEMFDYLKRYCRHSDFVMKTNEYDKKGQFKNSDSGIYYYFTSSINDFMTKISGVKNNCYMLEKINNDSSYKKLVNYIIKGNKHFTNKEYNNAVIYYKAALNVDYNSPVARKALVEANFQKAISMSLMKRNKEVVESFVYDNLSEIDDILSYGKVKPDLPFMDNDKFVSQLYSLKSAMLSVLLDSNSVRNKEQLKKKIVYYLNESIKYDPQNKLARELLEKIK